MVLGAPVYRLDLGTTAERKRNEWTPTNLPHELEQFRVAHDDGSYPCGAFLGFFTVCFVVNTR